MACVWPFLVAPPRAGRASRLEWGTVGVCFPTYGASRLHDGGGGRIRGYVHMRVEYLVVGLIALGLLVYLSYVLFRPEKF